GPVGSPFAMETLVSARVKKSSLDAVFWRSAIVQVVGVGWGGVFEFDGA
ncbi:MAG: hypothetical protein RL215_224, partial [Planctomycetota bacterium]